MTLHLLELDVYWTYGKWKINQISTNRLQKQQLTPLKTNMSPKKGLFQ